MLADVGGIKISRDMTYLVHDILQRIGAVNGEADKQKICLGVRQRTQAVVFFLAGSIPQCELDNLARWLVVGLGNVILKHSGDIFLCARFVLVNGSDLCLFESGHGGDGLRQCVIQVWVNYWGLYGAARQRGA